MFIKKSLIIVIGSILVAIGINFFLVPFHLLDGGGIGLGLIIHYLFDVKVGLAIIFISAPIFLVAWVNYRSFFYNGIHGMLISSLIIDIFYPFHILGAKIIPNGIVGALCGGILVGLGIGLMLQWDTTICGTDLLAQIVSRLVKVNAGICIFLIDYFVVLLGSIIVDSVSIFHSSLTVITVGITTSLMVRKHY